MAINKNNIHEINLFQNWNQQSGKKIMNSFSCCWFVDWSAVKFEEYFWSSVKFSFCLRKNKFKRPIVSENNKKEIKYFLFFNLSKKNQKLLKVKCMKETTPDIFKEIKKQKYRLVYFSFFPLNFELQNNKQKSKLNFFWKLSLLSFLLLEIDLKIILEKYFFKVNLFC